MKWKAIRWQENDSIKITKIYTLSDPVTHDVRYVGKTFKTLAQRHKQHIYKATVLQGQTKRDKWIRSVIAAGGMPIIQILETVTGDWRMQENYWIKYYDNMTGGRLVNSR